MKASPTENGNTAVEVHVRHLAPPGRLDAAATTYIVWVQAAGETAPQNLGALRVDEKLRGTLRTVTPFRRFDVFVTPEPGPTAVTPTGRRLLSARIDGSGG